MTTTTDLTRAAIARALTGPYVYRTVMPPQGGPELAGSPAPSQVSHRRGTALPDATIAALHRCWRRGDSTRTAAAECGVSQASVRRYFDRFRSAEPATARG